MSRLALALFVLFALVGLALAGGSSGDFPDTHSVVDATSDNWEDTVEAADLALVEFYAPWCGHCKNLAPAYQQLAEHFNEKNKDMNILIAKVDATQQGDLATKFGVRGYPTIKLFRKGDKEGKDYEGDRSVDGMRKYLEGQAGPAVHELSSKDDVDAFVKKNGLVAVAAFEAGSSEYNQFSRAADSLRDKLRFVNSADKSVVGDAKVVLYREFDEPANFTGEVKRKNIVEFLKKESQPLWGELTMSNARDHMAKNLPLLLMFVTGEQIKNNEVKGLLEPLMAVAQEYSDTFAFVYLNNDQFGQHQQRLGLKGETPAIAIDAYESGAKYPFAEEINADNFRKYVAAFKDGSLKPHLRSAEVPASNDEAVKVVVGKTFQDIVMDEGKDVMLEIYAPWCGHCKTLEPKYKELAEKLAGNSTVVIAKMDGTENDPPAGIKVSGFPTILFFPADKKGTGVSYSGAREVDEMYNWILENATAGKGATISDQSSEDKKDEL